MKPIYKNLVLESTILAITLSLQASVTANGESSVQPVEASALEGLKVELVNPNVTGARDLIASGECVIDGANLTISLNAGGWIEGATYSVRVSAVFGTQTVVLYVLNVSVPYYAALSNTPQEYEDKIVVVSTFGDGDKSGADASVYSKDGDDNAKITKPLSVGDGVANNAGAVASGRTDGEGSHINAGGDGAVASGYTNGVSSYINAGSAGAVASGYTEGDSSYINASSAGAVASGYTEGGSSYINAGGDGAVASGYTSGDSSYINASSAGAVASGYTNGDGSYIKAGGNGAVASGYTNSTSGNVVASGVGSQAFGIGTQATQDAQMAVGQCNVVDTDDSYQFIVGNGADNENRHNAFAVTKSGELALFKADGTPVILTAADLEALIASLPTN